MNTTHKLVAGVLLVGLASVTGIQSASAVPSFTPTVEVAPGKIGQNIKYEGGYTDRFGGGSSGFSMSAVWSFPGGAGCEAPPAGITLTSDDGRLGFNGMTTAEPGTYSNICATVTEGAYEVVVTNISIEVVEAVSLPESSGYVGSEKSFSGAVFPLTDGMSTLTFYRDGVEGDEGTNVALSSIGEDTTSGMFSVPEVTPGLYYVVVSTYGYRMGGFYFTVLEDAPVIDPAIAQTVGGTTSLAATGTDSTVPLLAGGILALAGLGLTFAARRRRASI